MVSSALSLPEMEAELGFWMRWDVMDGCLCAAGAILWQSHMGKWQWLGTHGIPGKYLADVPAVRDKRGEIKALGGEEALKVLVTSRKLPYPGAPFPAGVKLGAHHDFTFWSSNARELMDVEIITEQGSTIPPGMVRKVTVPFCSFFFSLVCRFSRTKQWIIRRSCSIWQVVSCVSWQVVCLMSHIHGDTGMPFCSPLL